MKIKAIMYLKSISRLLIFMFIILLGFTLLMTLVWCIPNNLIYDNMQNSLEIINREGREWVYTFTYALGCRLDNVTDGTMLEAAYNYSGIGTPLQQALSINGYSRYWHGYLMFLRPLMVFLDYTQIRYLYMHIYMLLFTILIIKVNNRLSKRIAIIFTIAVSLTYYNTLAYSLQFSSVYFVMLITSIYILYSYRGNWKAEKIGYLFLFLGMITNFVDLLTAPILTLGIPLIFIFLLNIKLFKDLSYKKNIIIMLYTSLMWGIGYAVCWISKWILALLFLPDDSMGDVIRQIALRTQGDSQNPVNRVYILLGNIYAMLPPDLLEIPKIGYFILVAAVFVVGLFINKVRTLSNFKIYIPFILLAVYPYAWYMVLANHSQVHLLFTYRTQLITVFALFAVYGECVFKRNLLNSE